ncbi:MAG TPA: TAXI family TRAP transporter solute-binding subunit [Clostridia bacterium]|nr:TAXI family TRAP transporter solute-binding subunit [Clostridia bacterium]
MKKFVSILLVTLLIAVGLTACGASSTPAASSAPQLTPSASSQVSSIPDSNATPSYEKPKFLSVGTAAAGGAYYPIGIAMADIITNELDIQTTAQVTGGAVENNGLIEDGTLQIAITQGPMAYAAVNGTAPYDKKHEKVAAMFSGLSKGVFHVVTLEGTGIKTMQDLKGKRVVMGPAGGGAINMAKDVWGEYGFTIDDVKATYISYSDGMSALTDGKCDAVVVQSAAPASAITELAVTRKDIVIIAIEDEMRMQIVKKYPYYAEYTIGKDVYSTSNDIKVINLSNMVVCSAELPEGLVYDMTKAFFSENLEKIKTSNPAAKGLSLKSAVEALPISLHPGAEKFFKEAGVL